MTITARLEINPKVMMRSRRALHLCVAFIDLNMARAGAGEVPV
jgi:hypothetical protein